MPSKKSLGDKSQLRPPELYQHLGEMPNTLPSRGRPNVDDNNLANYLDSLKQLLKHHRETHKKTDQ